MWCSDMDEEDFQNAECDGDCKNCNECEKVNKTIAKKGACERSLY